MKCIGFLAALTTLLLAGAAVGNPGRARLSMNGAGALRIGMNEQQIEHVLGRKIGPPEDYEDDHGCRYANPEDIAGGLHLMLIDGQLVRIDVDDASHLTLSGARVGDTPGELMRKIGGLRDSEHAYSGPEGRYLTKFSSNGYYGIRFEIEDGKVSRYYVGTAEAIQFVEGCL